MLQQKPTNDTGFPGDFSDIRDLYHGGIWNGAFGWATCGA
jgi:hypothetical protein